MLKHNINIYISNMLKIKFYLKINVTINNATCPDGNIFNNANKWNPPNIRILSPAR
uniref:Candidate secreted effector n=1 Tax=Meloidogyne incognita TaxID=6306 RepID=A0A914KIV8_MELIC